MAPILGIAGRHLRMNTHHRSLRSKALALAATFALAAGSLVANASTATAAPGDTTAFPLGDSTRDLAQGPAGNLWVTVENGTIAKVALDGTSIGYATNASPDMIAAGSANSMWFTNFASNQIGKISPEGAVELFPNGGNATAVGIALGPDGNMWFTIPADRKVGKITSSGTVNLYDTGGIPMFSITPGPEGSNRMYVASPTQNALGFVTMDGSFTRIDGPTGGVGFRDIQLINNQVWMTSDNGIVFSLTRLVGDSGFTQVSNPALGSTLAIGVGLNGTMWVSSTNSTISHVTTAGDVVATYPLAAIADASLQAQDGNLWATVDRGVTRVLTGVVPTSTAAPVLDPTTGLTAGASVSTSNGSWNYLPTSYAYQWQVCQTADATSCADAAGATGQSYTVATADVGKYLRAGVRASNLNGASQPSYSAVVATGAAPAPAPAPTPQPASGDTASVGNGATMTLDAPTRQKRNKRALYEVVFSVSDVQGTVTFQFKKGKRTKTTTVTLQDGIAEYSWKAPKKWKKGTTRVTATFTPAAGSPYQAAEVRDRVRIR